MRASKAGCCRDSLHLRAAGSDLCDLGVILINRAPVLIHISYQAIYGYEGWIFEYDRNKPFGPWPLKKDYEPRARAGARFYAVFNRFLELPEDEQELLRL